MGGGGDATADASNAEPALQIIVLGSGGGPQEANTTAFLVRSLSSGWRKGSVLAVDAGVHLSAITRILEETQPEGLGETDELSLPYVLKSGPFAGLELRHSSASANAAYVHRSLIDTYLITHPHLDHISGFVINTAGLPGTRPKRLAGLPTTIAAFKTHIFNNVIWPNLSDENHGAGLVTYMRLVEGGSATLGGLDGESGDDHGTPRGYLEISDGLAIKIWGVSHGHCIERLSHRSSGGGNSDRGGGVSGGSGSTRYGSMDGSAMAMGPVGVGMGVVPVLSPRTLTHHNSSTASNLSHFLQQQQQHQGNAPQSVLAGSTAASGGRTSSVVAGVGVGASGTTLPQTTETACVYDSSAYFVRDVTSGREILIFGDVEPDSISLAPRNAAVWAEAAPKIADGRLAAVFIECSYDDSQSVERLFGHLAPRFIIEELSALAAEVVSARRQLRQEKRQQLSDQNHFPGSDKKKRKRQGSGGGSSGSEAVLAAAARRRAAGGSGGSGRNVTSSPAPLARADTTDDPVSPRTVRPTRLGSGSTSSVGPLDEMPLDSPHLAAPAADLSLRDGDLPPPAEEADHSAAPLRGFKVVIIHVKDRLDDGPAAGETILAELLEYEREAQLGCEFVISSTGQDFYL